MTNIPKVRRRFSAALARVTLLSLISSIALPGSPANSQTPEITLLEVGKTIQRELAPEQKHAYRIPIGANQWVSIRVDQQALDVVLVLLAPGGERIHEVATSNGRNGPELLGAVVAVAGDYTLEIQAVEKGAPAGRYAATLTELREATDADVKSFRAARDFLEGKQLQRQRTPASLREALIKFGEAEKLRGELGEKRGQVEVITFAALTYQMLGDQQEAIATYQRGLPLAKEVGDDVNEATINNNLGFIYSRLDDFQNALFYYHLGLDAYLRNGREVGAADVLINIAATYNSLGEPERAVDYFSRAQALAHKHHISKIESRAASDLAAVYSTLGNHQKALELALEALPVLRSQRDIAGEQSTLALIGSEYFALGDDRNALEYFEQTLQPTLGPSIVLYATRAYYGMGKVYDRQGELSKAIENFKKSLELATRLQSPGRIARVLSALAESEFKAGMIPQAESDMRHAVELIESVRNRISTQELRTSFFSRENGEIYESYISLLMSLHKQAPTKGYDKEAFAASEKARARSLLELLAIARADIRQGIEPAMLERERSLRTQLNRKAAQLSQLLVTQAAADKVASAKSDYAKSEEELQQIEAKIREASPRYAGLTQSLTISLAGAQALLDKDSALLEYSLGNDRSFLWVITSDSLQIFELPKRADIEKAARSVYEALTARNRIIKFETPSEKKARIAKTDGEISQAASILSGVVLAPAASALTKKRLLIIPDGALYYVPFAILPIAKKPSATIQSPLVVDHEVANLPSASAWAAIRKATEGRSPAPRTVAVFADPVFARKDERYETIIAKRNNGKPAPDLIATTHGVEAREFSDLTRAITEDAIVNSSENLSRLPFTRQEAAAISRIASAQQSTSWLDFSATREAALRPDLSQYRIIHFATHSFISSAHPEVSGIVLSLIDERGKDQNGFIRASDVYNLQLLADLVVLSGCRTGLGKQIRGEGFVGITQSFMYAGAARVMVSLWDVHDEATAELMKRFYRGLLSEKLSPAAALRAAQISMAQDKRWSSPYYWAGFILQGEPK